MRSNLFPRLENYADSDFYPFHMPGHKRNMEAGPLACAYRYDITEIDGFDNLHQPEGIIAAAEKEAADLYHSEETYFLVGGSTAGILSAVSAVSEKGGKLLIARNCHKAVYHAAFLCRLETEYIYPEILEEYDIAGAVKTEDIRKKILEITAKDEKAKIAGVVITSPTYDGISSDVEEIAAFLHSWQIPLIVDQAHGAHFGFHPAFPENAVRQGADLVIQSVHKTLPAPTQTAIIHKNGSLVDSEKLRRYLRIYQSSSPSYLLMAGIEEALRITREEGYRRLTMLVGLAEKVKQEAEAFQHIKVCPWTEPGKLILSVKGSSITGQQLYDRLREDYHLQLEMASGSYATAILSMMDQEEGIQRLIAALKEIDADLSVKGQRECQEVNLQLLGRRPRKQMELWDAYTAAYKEMDISRWYEETYEEIEQEMRYGTESPIAAEFVNLYPPGIPLLVPGECLDGELIRTLGQYLKNGYNVQGIEDNKIKVVCLQQ